MGTVVISGVTFTIYGTLTVDEGGVLSADNYLAGSSAHAAAWAAANADTRSRALVDATRMLDAATWQGTRTSPSQPLAWPRTGVVDREGNAIDPNTIPTAIVYGSYELAALVLGDSSIATSPSGNGSSNVKRAWGGPAGVEFFGPQKAGLFALPVMRLVGQYLAASTATTSGGSEVFNNCGSSWFDTDAENNKLV